MTARQLSESELLESFEQSLTTLASLASTYDGGYAPICFLMAIEVQKLLTENRAAVKLRAERRFSTVDFGGETEMLNALHKLTTARLGGNPPVLDFLPDFYLAQEEDKPLKLLKFKDWWNKDIIYRASAAVPGTPPGLIPVNDSPSVPFADREKINRRLFVHLLRNKLGGHQASELPILLEDLDESRSWGSFAVETPKGVFSSHDGTLKTGISIIAAMMRQISHEVLVAYDRRDPAPPST